jgi:hypothetical protein
MGGFWFALGFVVGIIVTWGGLSIWSVRQWNGH